MSARFTYYRGDDTVERRDSETGAEAVLHSNGAGHWTATEIDGFSVTALTAAEAQAILGPDADLTAETVPRRARRPRRWRRWAAARGPAR